MTTVIGDGEQPTGWISMTNLTETQRKLVQDIHQESTSKRLTTPSRLEPDPLYPYPKWAPPVANRSSAEPGFLFWDTTTMETGTPVEKPSPTASSPKTLDSSHKVPVNLCPSSAIIAIAIVIAQGHKKPGRTIYNWRSQPISYMEYHGAAQRHLLKSIDGSDYDPELTQLAGVPIRHDWAAMSCLAIIEDARQAGTLVDDRPIKGGAEDFMDSLMVKK